MNTAITLIFFIGFENLSITRLRVKITTFYHSCKKLFESGLICEICYCNISNGHHFVNTFTVSEVSWFTYMSVGAMKISVTYLSCVLSNLFNFHLFLLKLYSHVLNFYFVSEYLSIFFV